MKITIWERALSLWWILVVLPPIFLWFTLSSPELNDSMILFYLITFTSLTLIGLISGFINAKKKRYTLWACFALLFSICGGILGIIFGIVALIKIKKNTNLKGKGLAIAAIVISIPIIFLYSFLHALDPAEFIFSENISPEYQVYNFCKEICLEEPDFNISYVEINPKNDSEYICSCFGNDLEVVSQYLIPIEYNFS